MVKKGLQEKKEKKKKKEQGNQNESEGATGGRDETKVGVKKE